MKILVILLSSSFIIQTLLAQNIEILFEERKPYVKKEKLSINGLVATPAIKALKESRISYLLKEKPSKRHLYEIKANQKQICALGWFKTKEREKFAKFSDALYQDSSLGIIARSNNKDDFLNISLDELLKKDYKMLAKASYSYGKFLDNKFKEYDIIKSEVYVNNEKMLLLIEKNRADFMFISKEEADLLLNTKKYKKISFFKIKNMPEGNRRYLICSKKVDDSLIEQINQYIK